VIFTSIRVTYESITNRCTEARCEVITAKLQIIMNLKVKIIHVAGFIQVLWSLAGVVIRFCAVWQRNSITEQRLNTQQIFLKLKILCVEIILINSPDQSFAFCLWEDCASVSLTPRA